MKILWFKRLIGRYVAEDVIDGKKVIVKANELITAEIAETIDKSSVSEVKIRSAFTCASEYGVCEKCYGINLADNKIVGIGAAVGIIAAQSIGEPGTQLTMRTFHSGGIATTDITQGLPRIEELFEARNPRSSGIVTPIQGTVKINENEDFIMLQVVPKEKDQEPFECKIENNAEIIVSDGDLVGVGSPLTAGPLNLQEMYLLKGPKATQEYILDEIQEVYGSQGVAIDDKHVEVIIRQMFNRVKIKKAGDSSLLPGETVTSYKLKDENKKVKELGGTPAEGTPVLLGITRVSRMAESWLDAASFEETSNVLTESAVSGRTDNLIGLKENVIIGRRIPVGEKAKIV